MKNIFRHFNKHIGLRGANIVELAIIAACIFLSSCYITRELSYDRHNSNVDNIVRLSLAFNNSPVDGRIAWNGIDEVLNKMPEIDKYTKIYEAFSSQIKYDNTYEFIDNTFVVKENFTQIFDIKLLCGKIGSSSQESKDILISRSFADKLSGDKDFSGALGKVLYTEYDYPIIVSGIFEDIPQTSHFKCNILSLTSNEQTGRFCYIYLLLKPGVSLSKLKQKIDDAILNSGDEEITQNNPSSILMPLADIHLKSHNLRELSTNGDMRYIYIIAGANLLLLIVVLFNLWLNSSLIFASNRLYYQIKRINGAGTATILFEEFTMALILGLISLAAGLLLSFYIFKNNYISGTITAGNIFLFCVSFLALTISAVMLPAVRGISHTLFLNTGKSSTKINFSYSNVKWMLIAQFTVVIVAVTCIIAINRQMSYISAIQAGGNGKDIIFARLSEISASNMNLLRMKLNPHHQIQSITSSFQLPGDAIRDHITLKKDGDSDPKILPVIVCGEDFLSFFKINILSGSNFSNNKYDYKTERDIFNNYISEGRKTDNVEEIIVNRKALPVLDIDTPENAIGQVFDISQGTIDYFTKCRIIGVVEDFNYTGVYEEGIPIVILKRNLFQFYAMFKITPSSYAESYDIIKGCWNEINPQNPFEGTSLSSVYDKMYYNELYARKLAGMFAILCLIIAELGLIIFMAYIVKYRTREILIRKVNGASIKEIVIMLNSNFIKYIALAFAIGTPVSYIILQQWLKRFAYKIQPNIPLFIAAGIIVLLIVLISISLQSYRAACSNPAQGLKN